MLLHENLPRSRMACFAMISEVVQSDVLVVVDNEADGGWR